MLNSEFVQATGFVQYRNGKVPAVRRCDLVFAGPLCRVTFEMTVRDIIHQVWTDGPRIERARTLQPRDLDVLAACATKLAGIPVPSE